MALPAPAHHTLSLATYRKNGAAIRTPVWFIVKDEKIWVGTPDSSLKVKRLRNNPKVQYALCNSSGKKILGEWSDGTARLVKDPATLDWLVASEKAKYRFQYWFIVQVLYPLMGKKGPWTAIEITPDS